MPHTPPPSEPPAELPSASAHAFFTGAAVVLVVAVMLCFVDQYTPIPITKGAFSVLAALFAAAAVGSKLCSVEDRQRRHNAAQAAELTAVKERLAELTSLLQTRPGPASCRPTGHMYVSGARQGDTGGVRAASVDAATDPSGLSLQRAREDGIEQGFEIGYAAQLAERGVPSLPRPRQRRLTGDS